jgi:competence protein ComEC
MLRTALDPANNAPIFTDEGFAHLPAQIAGLRVASLFHAAWLFAFGILLAQWQWLRPSWLLIALLLIAALTVLTIFRAPRLMLPLAATLILLLGALSAELEPHPTPSPQLAALSDGLVRTTEGTVIDVGPLRGESEENEESEQSLGEQARTAPSQRVDLQLATIESVTDDEDKQIPVDGRIRVQLHWPGKSTPQLFHCGDRIRLNTRLELPENFRDPNVWSRTDSLLDQGITSTARADASTVERLGTDSSSHFLRCQLGEVQHIVGARLQTLPARMSTLPSFLRLSPDDTAMLAAMVAGDRTYLTRSLRVGFERTGSFHLLVVSGLHLAVLAGLIFWLTRRLRIPPIPATILTIAAAFAYALFTGFATPIERSLWMVSVYLLGHLLNRKRSSLNAIGFAALCLLVLSPRSLFETSLQMTLLSVISIAGIAYPLIKNTIEPYRFATHDLDVVDIDARLPFKVIAFRIKLRSFTQEIRSIHGPRSIYLLLPAVIRGWLRTVELIVVAMVLEFALSLPMAIYFHRFTLFALPTNLLLMPLLIVLIPVAMLLLFTIAIYPPAATLPAMATAIILHIDLTFVRFFSKLPLADMRVPMPHTAQIVLFHLLLALALLLVGGNKWRRRLTWAAMLLAACIAVFPRPVEHPKNAMLFEAIDVGQGDSLLLISPEGKTLLIDGGGYGGGAKQTTQEFDIGEEVVSTTLWSRGIRHLDAVALTHAHSDHMGGLPAILRNFQPTEFWVGNNPPITAYKELLDEAASLGVHVRTLRAGDEFAFGSLGIHVFAPLPNYKPGDAPTNNDSLVLRTAFGQSSVLLEGDAEAPVEDAMLNQIGLQSTLLKVGHHGSITSTRPEFLARVAPRWAVISCGLHNRYGHPREEVLAELENAHIHTYSTDIEGAQCFKLDGLTVTHMDDCARSNGH